MKRSARYADVKSVLAQQYRDDREGYTAAKSDFVAEVLSMRGLKMQQRSAPT